MIGTSQHANYKPWNVLYQHKRLTSKNDYKRHTWSTAHLGSLQQRGSMNSDVVNVPKFQNNRLTTTGMLRGRCLFGTFVFNARSTGWNGLRRRRRRLKSHVQWYLQLDCFRVYVASLPMQITLGHNKITKHIHLFSHSYSNHNTNSRYCGDQYSNWNVDKLVLGNLIAHINGLNYTV